GALHASGSLTSSDGGRDDDSIWNWNSEVEAARADDDGESSVGRPSDISMFDVAGEELFNAGHKDSRDWATDEDYESEADSTETATIEAIEQEVVRKFDRYLTPLVAIVYGVSCMDRSNIGNVKVAGLDTDLQLGMHRFKWLLAASCLTYIAFERITVLQQIYPANMLFAVFLFCYGLVAALQSVVTDFAGLAALRACLGLSESALVGLGLPIYLSTFYRQDEICLRVGLAVSTAPLAGACASILACAVAATSGWLEGTLAPWRVLFMVEGFPSVIMAALVWKLLPNRPGQTHFLKPRERKWAVLRIREHRRATAMNVASQEELGFGQGTVSSDWSRTVQALKDLNAWLSSFMMFCCNAAIASVNAFLPTILMQLDFTRETALALSALVHLLSFIFTALTARASKIEDTGSSTCFAAATHDIAALVAAGPAALPDEPVVLHGYLRKRTDMGRKLSFAQLTDTSLDKSIQVVALGRDSKAIQQLRGIDAHSPVVARGTVQRKPDAVGDDGQSSAGELELALEDIQCLNAFPMDIIMKPKTVFPPENRHLQIRNSPSLRHALQFRSKVRGLFRDALENTCTPAFVEIETPLLFKSTPEGAREFIVPTRRKGYAYALPQSPQQYKQVLMASGIPRYYQFARCFRDEDLRADRQPEFTQLDMEMAFATGEDVMQIMERVVRQVWARAMPAPLADVPFPRITYQEAMARFGSDKPDTRYGMEIKQLTVPATVLPRFSGATEPVVIEGLKVDGKGDASSMQTLVARAVSNGLQGAGAAHERALFLVHDASAPLLPDVDEEISAQIVRELDVQHGDLIVLHARPKRPFAGGSTRLGELRRELHGLAVQLGLAAPPTGYSFLWVHQFPLFTPNAAEADAAAHPGQGGSAGFSATHHPFTAPHAAADIALLAADPAAATADHYDLVLNGVELGGGSRRVHHAAMQEFIFREILRMPDARVAEFAHLLAG
ncbi:hypothetical protein KEM52_000697, partial [Ascosphaera acerosa]